MSSRFTLGAVSYLNALPLYHALEARGEVVVRRAVPSKLAAMLESGQCDAAIMPVVDFLRGFGSQIISDACVGTKLTGSGAVQSVLLFHTGPLEKVEKVAVDSSSHSSVALTRVLLADAYGVQPPFTEHAPSLPAMLAQHDAALIIGDAALEAARDYPAIPTLDLGAAWKAHTGLPFVFAAWIARRDLSESTSRELGQTLSAARDEGFGNLQKVVAENPIATTLAPTHIEKYLRDAVEFHFTPKHHAGLEEFRKRCEKHRLL